MSLFFGAEISVVRITENLSGGQAEQYTDVFFEVSFTEIVLGVPSGDVGGHDSAHDSACEKTLTEI